MKFQQFVFWSFWHVIFKTNGYQEYLTNPNDNSINKNEEDLSIEEVKKSDYKRLFYYFITFVLFFEESNRECESIQTREQ